MASSSCKRRANCTLRRFVIQELKCVSLCRLLCYLDWLVEVQCLAPATFWVSGMFLLPVVGQVIVEFCFWTAGVSVLKSG